MPWQDPYLETCCRSALHRLLLCEAIGRPDGMPDAPCLRRLIGMGFAHHRPDGRTEITPAGRDRHRQEISAA